MDFLPIGSAAWMRGKDYQDKYSKRINQFAASTTLVEEKFWRQLAQSIIQLASVRLPKIGSIYPP